MLQAFQYMAGLDGNYSWFGAQGYQKQYLNYFLVVNNVGHGFDWVCTWMVPKGCHATCTLNVAVIIGPCAKL